MTPGCQLVLLSVLGQEGKAMRVSVLFKQKTTPNSGGSHWLKEKVATEGTALTARARYGSSPHRGHSEVIKGTDQY